MCLLLLDGGAICILDLLHAYTLQLHIELDSLLPLPPDVSVDGQPVQKVLKAWSKEAQGTRSKKGSAICRDRKIFNKNEMDLVVTLIKVVDMFAKGTHSHDTKNTAKDLQQKIDAYKFMEINNIGSEDNKGEKKVSPKRHKKGNCPKSMYKNSGRKQSVRKCVCCKPEGMHGNADDGSVTVS